MDAGVERRGSIIPSEVEESSQALLWKTKGSMSAKELLERAEELRRNNRFGDAINLYREAAAAPDASEEIVRKALASVELMYEINGFVNVDLMNP